MNYRRRLISSAALAAVTALVFSLPHLIPQSVIVSLLTRQLSRHFPGRIEVQSCSLHWSGGVRCEGVRYTDDLRAIRLQLPRIATDKGLLTLLLAPQYLGEIILDKPTLVFLPPGNGANTAQDDNPPPPPDDRRQSPASWWEQRSLRFKLQDGQILAERASGPSVRAVARKLNLSGDLSLGTINYVLDFQSGQTVGRFHAQGFLDLPVAGQPFFASLVSRSILDVRSMEIEPILELAASRFAKVPRGSGLLNGACRLRMAGIDNLEVEGLTSLNGLELSGGFLGDDRPRLQQVRLKFEGSKRPAEGWRLSQLELQSEPLNFSAHGLLDRQRIDFNGRGEADLAQLATGLPHLFAIHQQTTIHQGKLKVAFQADGEPDRINLKADCDTERLGLTQAGRPYAWDKPLSLHAAAVLRPVGLEVRRLHFQAPFLTVEGEDGPGGFALRATAELDHLCSELDKIFALDLHAKGRLKLVLDSNRIAQDQLRLTTALTIDDFAMDFSGQPLLPVHPFSVRGELIGRPWFLPWSGLQSLHLAADGWPGSFSLDADQTHGAETENCRLRTTLDLARLEQVARIARGQDNDLRVQGQLQVDTRGGWREADLQLRQLKGRLTDFALVANGSPMIREPQIALGLERGPLYRGLLNLGQLQVIQGDRVIVTPEPAFCRIDLQPFALDLRHLRLRAPETVLDVQGRLGRRRDGGNTPMLEIRGRGGLPLLATWWQRQGWLDGRIDAQGQAEAALIMHPAFADRPQSTQFSMTVQDLSIKQGSNPLYDDPKVVLDLELQPAEGDATTTKIPRLTVHSSLFSFSGAGLAHRRETTPLLDLQGALHPRTAAVAQMMHSLVPGEVLVKEARPGNTLLSIPLHFPVDINQVTLSGQLPLEGLRYRGIALPALQVPVDLNRGVLGMRIEGGSNGGRVSLHPQWRPEGRNLVLGLEPDSQVLRQLPITGPVADGLLPLFPPFGCLVEATGTIGLSVTRFSLPVGENEKKRRPDFAVVIDLEKARPLARQALKQVLETAGLGDRSLRFQERALICEGWNGSVTCAPLRLGMGGEGITLSGSRRRNGTLDYRVALPVTEQLARRAGVTVYGNFTAVADISGTQAAPVFDQARFFRGLAGQITDGLPKPLAEHEGRAGSPRNGVAPAVQPPGNN
ncbi:MAG: hypothetical protein AB7E77_02215 [Desulfobulbus sp.]